MANSLLISTTTFSQRLRRFPWLVASPVFIIFVLTVAFGLWQYTIAQSYQQQAVTLKSQQNKSSDEALIARINQITMEEQRQQLEQNLKEATSTATLQSAQQIQALYDQYSDVKIKMERNSQAKLDISAIEKQSGEWGAQLLNQRYGELTNSLAAAIKSLDDQFASYQASLIKAPPTPVKQATGGKSSSPTVTNPAGYSSSTVSTSRGNFAVKLIKLPLSQVNVRTVSASTTNCADNCPAKPLASYVQEQGGFAGINGSYFCPPDYSACAGKKYSYDFAVYNSPTGNWINQNALGWTSTGLAVFNGSTASFYQNSSQFPGGAVTAGISNFPTLLVHNNAVIITDAQIDSAQRNKGVRGVLGVGGGNIYLAIISGASVTDAAYAIHALGATEALNLDGGGSAALYIDGSYKAGPGRLLPNAIVLTH